MFTRAIDALERGDPILLYDFDDREAESDLLYLGKRVTPKAVADMRLNAGAPLSIYISWEAGERLGLKTYLDFIVSSAAVNQTYRNLVNPAGGFDPRFAITLDYRGNKTGCSHVETSQTITEFSALIEAGKFSEFSKHFRSPGHVPLIIASPGLLQDRVGHTELIMTLLRQGGLPEVAAASEMIDPETGHSADHAFAKRFAASRGLEMLHGNDLLTKKMWR